MRARLALRSKFGVPVGVVLALAVSVDVAASTAKPKQPTASEPVTLSLLTVETQRLGMDILVKNFNNVYPNIRVNVQYLPANVIRQVLPTQLTAGNAPDIFQMQAGNSSSTAVWAMAKAGHLLDLSGSPWEKRISKYEKSGVQVGRKTFAYPAALFFGGGVAYNRALFNQLGVRIPQKFRDVLEMCRRISAAGKIPMAAGFGQSTGFSPLINQMVSIPYVSLPTWTTLRNRKQVRFQSGRGSALWRASFNMLVEMKNAGCFSPGAAGTNAAQAITQFVRGDAAMLMINTINAGSIDAINPNFKASWFLFPARNSKTTRAVVVPSNDMGVNAATRYPAQAKTFINFIARPKQATLFNTTTGGTSGYDLATCDLTGEVGRAFLPYCKAGKLVQSPRDAWPNANIGTDWLPQILSGVYTGQSSVGDVLRGMDSLWENPNASAP